LNKKITINFASGSGDLLVGDLYIPEKGNRKNPLLVFAHGMLSNRSGKASFMAELTAQSGAFAFTFDFGGCGDSGGNFYPISYERRKADLISAVNQAVAMTGVEKIGIVGSSMGGSLAIVVASIMPVVSAVYAIAPPADGGAVEAASLLSKPLFLIHGDADEIVPLSSSLRIAESAKGHALRKIEKGADHSFSDRMDRIGKEIVSSILYSITGSGAYQLLLAIRNRIPPYGFRGNRNFRKSLEPGYYIYSGSGGNSLESRIGRHLKMSGSGPLTKNNRLHTKGNKRFNWHIDRLLSNPGTLVISAARFHSLRWPGIDEHRLANMASNLPGAFHPDPGFGSSDCKVGCVSHLVKIQAASDEQAVSVFSELSAIAREEIGY
jgi:Uri superfamily endonuclease/alpha/beta superfamily hydrolase